MTISFGHSDNEVWRLWHQALHGDRGIIIYDEENRYLNKDGTPSDLGLLYKPVYNELISGVVKQYTYTAELPAKAAIHYSHASITAFWKLEVSSMKSDWVDRGSGTDRFDSDFFRLRESAVKLFEDNQAPYKFTAYAQLENGDFENDSISIIYLPQSIAMSKKEIRALKRFTQKGGVVVADCTCAVMDEHCKESEKGGLDDFFGIKINGNKIDKKLCDADLVLKNDLPDEFKWAEPLINIPNIPNVLSDVSVIGDAHALFTDNNGNSAVIVKNHGLGKTVYLNMDITNYHRWRLKENEGDNIRKIFAALFEIADVKPYTPLSTVNEKDKSSLEIFNRKSGKMDLISVHRNYQLRISELGPPEYQDISLLQNEFDVDIDLGKTCAVYDLRNEKYLGMTDRVSLNMPIWEPIILTAFESEIKSLDISIPKEAAPGDIVPVIIGLNTENPADTHVFRCTVSDPDGNEIKYYTQNITAPYGKAKWSFPLAKDIRLGKYSVNIKDTATGISTAAVINIQVDA